MPRTVSDRDDLLDQPHLRSTLVLRRGWWRHFVTELAAVVVTPVWVVLCWGLWLRADRSPQLLVLAVVATAWGTYVTWSWSRRGLVRLRMMSSGAPTLSLSGAGIWVRHPFGPSGGALLGWADCQAVVVSPMPTRGRTPESYRAYVEFVPRAPGAVEGAAHPRDQRTTLLGRPGEQVLTVWTELAGIGCTTGDVVAWLRRWRPELRIVDSLRR